MHAPFGRIAYHNRSTHDLAGNVPSIEDARNVMASCTQHAPDREVCRHNALGDTINCLRARRLSPGR